MFLKNTMNTRSFSEIDGRLTHLLVRSDRLDSLDDEDMDYLLGSNIKTIIDLRESKDRNSTVINSGKFDYNIFDFYITAWSKLKEEYGEKINDVIYDILPEQYLGYAEQREVIFKIFKKIIEAKNGVLIMCHYGKDRTGAVVALLLLVAGIEENIIIRDYAVSSENVGRGSGQGIRGLFESKPIVMKSFLEKFYARFKDVASYLRYVGINEDEYQILKMKLLQGGERWRIMN